MCTFFDLGSRHFPYCMICPRGHFRLVNNQTKRSVSFEVVGTLRVPLYFYPYWRDLDGIGHCQERHKECAYYFF